jgi:putative flippase GtrA
VARTGFAARFTRYSALSLITVPVGYALLLLARHFFDVNAGLLNLIVGTVLTPPSFLLYRHLVWPGGTGARAVARQLFSFWQTVMLGALASSVLIGAADQWLHANNAIIVLAGLTGQGVVFIGRFFWLDLVTFKRRAAHQPDPNPDPDQTHATPVIVDASPE